MSGSTRNVLVPIVVLDDGPRFFRTRTDAEQFAREVGAADRLDEIHLRASELRGIKWTRGGSE